MSTIETPVLRPLSLGQLLDRAFRLYRQHFLVFIGIIAIGVIPVYVIQYVLNLIRYPEIQRATEALQNNPDLAANPFRMFATSMAAQGGADPYIVLFLTFIFVQGIATGALVKAIEDSYLSRPVTLLGSYRKIFGSILPLMIALVLGMLIWIALFIWWFIVPCVGWITGLGMLIFFQNAVFLLIPATVIIEQKRGVFAIWRAWELTRRRFWWVLGFVFVLVLLGYVILIGPSTLVTALAALLSQSVLREVGEQTAYAIETGLSQAVQMLFQVIYLPLQLTALVLMYFDLRIRTEGFDLALQAATTEEGQVAAEMTPPAPATESQSPITLNEAGYFAAISVGLLMVCVIFYVLLIVVAMASIGALQGM
jgi:hypothetical protein